MVQASPSLAPQRVAVTGLGAITALGGNAAGSWERLLAGESGIRRLTAWDMSRYESPYGAPAASVNGHDRRLARLDPCHRMAVMAARDALADSRLDIQATDRRRAGLHVGTSLGGMLSGMRYDRERRTEGRRRRSLLVRYPFHVLADVLGRETGFVGPRSVPSTACTASTIALALGYESIRSGEADVALVGGVDPLTEFTLAGFNAMKNTSRAPCAPFSAPPGLTLGEAASFLVLERHDVAAARGARIYAEMLGYALSADAYHATAPDSSGASQKLVFEAALERAGVDAAQVDYVCAHGTGTESNDAVESRVLGLVLGNRRAAVPVSSLKGALGHTLGAAGATEALFTVLAIHDDRVPPTANFRGPREGCDLDYVPNRGRTHPVRVAVKQNFAFGGNNAALVFGKTGAVADAPARPLAAHDVVVTGLGVVSPIGIGRDRFRDALRATGSGVQRSERLAGAIAGVRLAGALDDFAPEKLTRAQVRRLDRLSQLVVVGTELAARDAALRITRDNAGRIGIVVGTMNGPIASCAAFHEAIVTGRPEAASPIVFPNTVFNACAGQAAINLRARGPNVVMSLGQASGAHALATAAAMIRTGQADVLIAGGADELVPDIVEGYTIARLLSPFLGGGEEAMRPLAAEHNGMVLGEGAAFLVLESRAHAEARGARIFARIAGWANGGEWSRDAYGSAALRHVIETALDRSGFRSGDIGLVAAAGIAAPRLDRAEADALAAVFDGGPAATTALSARLGISGATTALSAGAAVLALAEGFLPAGGAAREDPILPGLVEDSRAAPGLRAALIDGLSFGGARVALVLAAEGA